MGTFSRNKGKRGERQVATALREVFPAPDEVKRGWQTRSGSDEPDVKGVPGFWFESKLGKRPNCFAALEQAIEASGGRAIPIAVVRRDRTPAVAVLQFEDFLVLLGVLYKRGCIMSDDSHKAFFAGKKQRGEEAVISRLKRIDELENKIQQFLLDRSTPGASPNIQVITDNEFFERYNEYTEAVAKGESAKCDFIPLSAYAAKLITSSGTVVRPILAGEVGMIGSKILVLQSGYGTGSSSAVGGVE